MRTFLRRYPRLTRWGKRLLIAVLAWEVIYVVSANIVLATHVVDKLVNASTDDVEMHVGSGWTLLPGYVHVRDVSIRVNDTDLQALLYVEEATANVSILWLIDKKLLVYSANATGLRYYMRTRVEAINDENRATVAAYPPIPGVEPPVIDPVRHAAPKPPKEKFFRYEVHDGVGEGNEFWLNEFHFRGTFRGTGGFFFWPLSEVTVYPIAGGADHGTVAIADEQISEDVSAHLEATVGKFVMPDQKGIQQLRGLDAHATLMMSIPNDKFLKTYIADGMPHATLRDGRLVANLDFHEKHFSEHSAVLFTAKSAGVREPFGVVEGPVQLTGVAHEHGSIEAGFDTLGMSVHVPSLKSTASSPWKLERTSVRTDLHVQIDDPLGLSIAAMQGQFVIPDLDWVTQASGGKLHAKGKLVSELKVKRDLKNVVTGTVETKIDDVQLTAETLAIGVVGKMTTSFASQFKTPEAAATTTSLAQVDLDLPQFTLRSGSRSRTTWLKATLPSAQVKGKPTPGIQSKGIIQLGDSAVLVVPVDDQAGPFAALAAKWLMKGGAKLQTAFKVDGGNIDFTLDKSQVGLVTVEGFLKTVSDQQQGAFWISAEGLSTGLKLQGATPTVVPLASETWLQEQRAAIH